MPPERGVVCGQMEERSGQRYFGTKSADFWECHVIYGVYRRPLLEVVTVVSRGTNIFWNVVACPPRASERVQGRSAGGDNSRPTRTTCIRSAMVCMIFLVVLLSSKEIKEITFLQFRGAKSTFSLFPGEPCPARGG